VEARGREGIKDKGRGKGEKGRGSATFPQPMLYRRSHH